MTVPLFFYGKDFPKGKAIEENISLLEIAPTIAALLGLPAEHEWEGRSLI
jgi:arylsulfatase A-like enzyme